MTATLRQLFYAMSLRERLLLGAFVWAIIVAWLLSLLDHTKTSVTEIRQQSEILNTFQLQLAEADTAELLLQQARAGLDSGQTFTASQLVGQLDTIARETNLASFDLSVPSTQETDIFSFHTVRLNIKRAQLEELLSFDNEIKTYSPYIALSQVQITSNRRDPRYLDAVFELASFELKEDALNE